jgi:hypothetical protein
MGDLSKVELKKNYYQNLHCDIREIICSSMWDFFKNAPGQLLDINFDHPIQAFRFDRGALIATNKILDYLKIYQKEPLL